MKTKLQLLLTILIFALATKAQSQNNYNYSLVHNSGDNFSVVAIPTFSVAAPDPIPLLARNVFALLVPEGITFENVIAFNGEDYTVEFYTAIDAFEPGKDAYLISNNYAVPYPSLGTHVIGQPIVFVSFDIVGVNAVTSLGSISLMNNNDPIPTAESVFLSNFITYPSGSSADNTGVDDYYIGNTATTSFALSVDETKLEGVSVYPNPTADVLRISGVNDIKSVEIMNIIGQRVQLIKNSNEIVDMSNLQSGVYFIKITGENGSATKKILKK